MSECGLARGFSLTEQSAWSNEVMTDTQTNLLELACWVFRYFKPARVRSLDAFVKRNIRLNPPMHVPIRLADIEIELLSRDLTSLHIIRASDQQAIDTSAAGDTTAPLLGL